MLNLQRELWLRYWVELPIFLALAESIMHRKHSTVPWSTLEANLRRVQVGHLLVAYIWIRVTLFVVSAQGFGNLLPFSLSVSGLWVFWA